MNKNTILLSLATYVVATAVLLGGVSALGLMPRDGVDGKDGAPGLDGKDGADGKDAALKIYVASKTFVQTCSGAIDDACSHERFYSVTARCKSGDTLLGGGIKNDNSAWFVESYPNGNAWTVEIAQAWIPSTGSITAYAICQDNP